MSCSENLYEKLIRYSKSQAYPFHMPGHKRQMMFMNNPYRFDLTEIEGFDNLHGAEDLLKREQERAARLYGSEESHFMVNGSTGGILSAIAGVVHRGDRVLVARNCHTSVYHGLELNGLRPVYMWPELDERLGIYQGLTRKTVETALEKYSDIRAVIFTSPTYEGILSDVKGICEAAHLRGIPCIVDEAHGAHLRWIGISDAVSCGADVAIQSLHKTLPALTQTALIHMNGALVDRERICKMLAAYQTSSPSYVLMASISQCMTWLEQEGAEKFEAYKQQTLKLRERLENMKYLYLYKPETIFDWGKLVLCVGNRGGGDNISLVSGVHMTGRELYDRLRIDFGLQMEMTSTHYALAMTTVGDSPEGFQRLAEALETIDADLECRMGAVEVIGVGPGCSADTIGAAGAGAGCFTEAPERRMEIDAAVELPTEEVPLSQAARRVMGDYLYLYPPGIPMLVPGEVIRMEHIEQIQNYLNQGLEVHGGYLKEKGNVKVILHHG